MHSADVSPSGQGASPAPFFVYNRMRFLYMIDLHFIGSFIGAFLGQLAAGYIWGKLESFGESEDYTDE